MPRDEETVAEICAEIEGPVETPFEGGVFHVKLVLGQDFPASPPRGFFLTKIYHPNVSTSGDICVNTLKRDWSADTTIIHIFQVIRCLLIVPFPESSLNDEAGKLFMQSYDEYARRAALMTAVHASPRKCSSSLCASGAESGATSGRNSPADLRASSAEEMDGEPPLAKRQSSSKQKAKDQQNLIKKKFLRRL